MGRDKNEIRKLETRKSIFNGETPPGDGFDWGSVDCERLRQIIGLVTSRGGAIRFGYSRDGQAGSIGIYYGDARDTIWHRPSENIEVAFQRIESTFNEFKYTGGKSPD